MTRYVEEAFIKRLGTTLANDLENYNKKHPERELVIAIDRDTYFLTVWKWREE